jgi:hypothetical protein
MPYLVGPTGKGVRHIFLTVSAEFLCPPKRIPLIACYRKPRHKVVTKIQRVQSISGVQVEALIHT